MLDISSLNFNEKVLAKPCQKNKTKSRNIRTHKFSAMHEKYYVMVGNFHS